MKYLTVSFVSISFFSVIYEWTWDLHDFSCFTIKKSMWAQSLHKLSGLWEVVKLLSYFPRWKKKHSKHKTEMCLLMWLAMCYVLHSNPVPKTLNLLSAKLMFGCSCKIIHQWKVSWTKFLQVLRIVFLRYEAIVTLALLLPICAYLNGSLEDWSISLVSKGETLRLLKESQLNINSLIIKLFIKTHVIF